MNIRTSLIVFLVAVCSRVGMDAAEIWERTGTFDGEKIGAVISLGQAGNGNLFACVNTGAPTYTSTDHGATWKKSTLPSNNYVNAFATRDSIILAATIKGIYLSTNHGTTWKLSNTGLTSLIVKSLQFSSNGTLYAGTHDGGIFRSADLGRTWAPVNTGLSTLRITALMPIDSTTVITATDGEGLFISTNSGDIWKPITADVRLNSVRSFAVNSAGAVFAGTDQYGVFRSSTRGDTWDYTTSDITSAVNALVCNDQDIYAATGFNGVYHSTDNGTTWVSENTGIEGNASYSFGINALGQVLVGANGGAVYRRVTVNGVSENTDAAGQSIDRISSGNNELRITFTLSLMSNVAFSLYSILGEKIATFDASTNVNGTHEFRTSVNWPRGIYLCRMETSRHSTFQVFHIQ